MLFPASAAGATIALQGQKLTQDVSKSRFGISYLPEPEERPIGQIKPLSAQKEAILDLFDAQAPKYGLTPNRTALRRLLTAESGINPLAINKSSGSCGLGQALPCSKLLVVCHTLEDVDCQVGWVLEYIKNRYGSIEAANDFQLRNNWY